MACELPSYVNICKGILYTSGNKCGNQNVYRKSKHHFIVYKPAICSLNINLKANNCQFQKPMNANEMKRKCLLFGNGPYKYLLKCLNLLFGRKLYK